MVFAGQDPSELPLHEGLISHNDDGRERLRRTGVDSARVESKDCDGYPLYVKLALEVLGYEGHYKLALA